MKLFIPIRIYLATTGLRTVRIQSLCFIPHHSMEVRERIQRGTRGKVGSAASSRVCSPAVQIAGASIKNWPLIGSYTVSSCNQSLPLYHSRSRQQVGLKGRKVEATFPQALLDDVPELFKVELAVLLDDLFPADVRSRVQYVLKKSTPSNDSPSAA